MNGAGTEVEALGDGFRRSGPSEPIRWSGLRDRLIDAAAGQGRAVRDGLALFRSWQEAGSAAPALFSAGALRNTAASRRALQRLLRLIGTRPMTLTQLASCPRGTPARVRGRIFRARRKLHSHIWFKSETCGNNVRLLFEEGHDFFLTANLDLPDFLDRQAALVISAGGYLMGGIDAALDAGDPVEVFGFVDRVIDAGSISRSGHPGAGRLRGEPLALALRAGDELPILLWKVSAEVG